MTRTNRWFLYGPFLAFGVFLIFWGVLWRSGVAMMRERLAAFVEDAEAAGVAIRYGAVETKGFPFFLRGVVANFSATKRADRYDCAALTIDALPYAQDRIVFSCGGAQTLTTHGEIWTIRAADARAGVERDRDKGWIAKAETGAFAANSGRERISIERALVNIAPAALGSPALQGSLRGFGIAAAQFDVERIDAAFTLAPEDAGGMRKLSIDGVDIVGEGAKISGSGALFLRDGAPATGRIDADIERPAGLARAFEKARMIDAEEARTAEAGLGMLAVAAGGALRAPIDLTADEIRVAGVRIAKRKTAVQP